MKPMTVKDGFIYFCVAQQQEDKWEPKQRFITRSQSKMLDNNVNRNSKFHPVNKDGRHVSFLLKSRRGAQNIPDTSAAILGLGVESSLTSVMELDTSCLAATRFHRSGVTSAPDCSAATTYSAQGDGNKVKIWVSGTILCYSMLLVILSLLASLSPFKDCLHGLMQGRSTSCPL